MLKVRSYKPDVAIVDIRMPPTQTDEGLRAAKEIREKHPETAVLVLSQYLESAYALELLSESAEGVGYLLKDRVADIPEFVAAVKRVGEGGSALDPSVVSQLVGRRRADDPVGALTPREREVLELMAEGLSNAAIAERMVVTERAVEKHVTSIFGKLRLGADSETHRRVLAVLAFLRARRDTFRSSAEVRCGYPHPEDACWLDSRGARPVANSEHVNHLSPRRNREPGICIRSTARRSGSRPALAAPPLQGGTGRARRERLGRRHAGVQPHRHAGADDRRPPAGRRGRGRARRVRA